MKLTTTLLAAVSLCATAALAADDAFQNLANQLPRSANAVVLLNVEKAKDSPLGVKMGWRAKGAKAFQDGVVRIPPQAMRMVLAAQLDFETMRPVWEAAVVDLAEEVDVAKIGKTYGGTPESIEQRDAVALFGGTYGLKLGLRTLGAVSPASRQFVARWMRDMRPGSAAKALSPYLEQAAGYSDSAGSEVIMAIDLEGAIPSPRVAEYLASKEWLKKQNVDLTKLGELIVGVKGIRVGVRFSEEPAGSLVVDFADDTAIAEPVAKQLLLGVLADVGMKIDDLESWTAQTKGTTIVLSGKFSDMGLRHLLSVVPSPAPSVNVTKAEDPAEVDPSDPATVSKQHFETIVRYLKDLRAELRDVQTFGQKATWCDRYAGKIEKMPILGVDKDLLQYSAFVAQQLRQVSDAVRGANIRSGVQKSQVSLNSPNIYGYGYNNGWYGAGYSGAAVVPYGNLRYQVNQKYAIQRSEESGARGVEMEIKKQIADATRDIRQKMTEKYNVEFKM